MPIYINKNNRQSGPYEEHVVIEQLRSGYLSPNDLGIRHGETTWTRIGDMFPDTVARPAAPASAAPTAPEPQYRNTILQKIFFGLCFLGAIGILAASVYYIFTFGSSGDLEADLSRLGFRDLAKYLAIGAFVSGFFIFLALLLSFKRKLIRSNGARIALRVFFVLVLLAGFGSLAFGAISYLSYSAPTPTKASESNELLRALEAGSAATGPYEAAMIALPIGVGLFLFGVSGTLMTKRARD